MEAVVLAGGLGTRLRPAVADVPKPMAPVGGRPFLEHLLEYWIGEGVRRAVLAVGYKHDMIRRHFGSSFHGCDIAYAVEDRPLGTGGALLNSLPLLEGKGTCLLLNGDTYFAVRLRELESLHRARQAAVTLSLFRSLQGARYTSVSLDAASRVTALGGRTSGEMLVNGGALLFQHETFRGISRPKSGLLALENDLLATLLRDGRAIFGYTSTAPFVDIGVPEDWRAAERVIAPN